MKKNNLLLTMLFSIACTSCCYTGYCAHTIVNISFSDTAVTASFKVALPDTLVNKKRIVYNLKAGVDVPLIITGAVWSAYASRYIYNKGASTPEQVSGLTSNNINQLDRWGIYPYSAALDKLSYYPFYAAFPLPLVFFLTGNGMRSDFVKLGYLYLESMAVTGLLGYSATYFTDKYRPYVYDQSTSIDQKTNQNAKNSFYSGHVAVIATSTFFMAEVYAEYYPNSKIKWLFFGLSAAATAGMGYIRLEGGMHFPSDILLGSAIGTLSGILVPYFHSHKIIKNTDLTVMPFGNATVQGLSIIYSFNK